MLLLAHPTHRAVRLRGPGRTIPPVSEEVAMRPVLLSLLVVLSLATAGSAPAAERQHGASSSPATASKPAATPLDINAATADQFERLPGIGASTAARIVEYRQKHGPFKKVEDLMNVRGIGEKSFLRLKPLITVAPPRSDRSAQ
jgi:comEA protein